MAQPGFVPAWKRLGLKLQRFPASEPSDRENKSPHDQESAQHGSALQENSASVEPTKDTFRLGKRKHHLDGSEIEGESSKKSKNHRVHDPTSGHAVDVLEAPTDSPTPAPSDVAPAVEAQPKGDPNHRMKKGDPNYRKKKGKPPRSNAVSRDIGMQSTQRLAAPNARTPSLSPGQPDAVANGSTLLPSTETGPVTSPFLATPEPRRATSTSSKDDSLSLSPAKTDRRKSVTFTPDTKTSDGNSASNLFKKWVADQKGQSADFSSAEVSQFTEPPKVHIANSDSSPAPKVSKSTTVSKGKKKDPSRYLNYLSQYHQDRANWKFNKAIQNDVIENSLNVFRIPEEYSDALLEYVRGLKGAGVIHRLKDRCMKTIEEINKAEETENMDGPEVRHAAKEEALQERLSKERKRRRLDGDMENLMGQENSEGYIRRLKGDRAKALLTVLINAEPISTTSHSGLDQNAKQQFSELARSLPQNNPRKRKSRTDISSDESSDSSSSEDESSSSESSSSEDSASDSSSSTEDRSSADSSETGTDSDSSDGSDDSSSADDSNSE